MSWKSVFNNLFPKALPPNPTAANINPNRHTRRANAKMLIASRPGKGKCNPIGAKLNKTIATHKLAINNPGGIVSEYFRNLQKEKHNEKTNLLL